MKVALAQSNIIWEDKESNFIQAESLIADAAKDSADIIFFPEYRPIIPHVPAVLV